MLSVRGRRLAYARVRPKAARYPRDRSFLIVGKRFVDLWVRIGLSTFWRDHQGFCGGLRGSDGPRWIYPLLSHWVRADSDWASAHWIWHLASLSMVPVYRQLSHKGRCSRHSTYRIAGGPFTVRFSKFGFGFQPPLHWDLTDTWISQRQRLQLTLG